jgi:hypothetical protein
MGLFDQITNAIGNPNQQASTDQLSGILQTVEQLGRGQGASSSTTQAALSIVGNYVRSSLQQKRMSMGDEQTERLVDQYSGTTSNPQAVQDLFTPDQQRRVVQDTAQKTGLNATAIQAMLPILVPLVLNLLRTGSSTQAGSQRGSNSVLNMFLDSDRSGSVDMGDVVGLASQFLNQRRSG